MAETSKYDRILDALQSLLESKDIQTISVSEIAQTAGIAKGSVYYYFSSKDAILEALVERSYKKPLETAKSLAKQTDVAPFTRMAMIFQACRNSSIAYNSRGRKTVPADTSESAYLQQKYVAYLVDELKPALAEIIRQGIEIGVIHFDYPDALAEIVLIILTIEMGSILAPSSRENFETVIRALIVLLEKGTDNPAGSLNFLMTSV